VIEVATSFSMANSKIVNLTHVYGQQLT